MRSSIDRWVVPTLLLVFQILGVCSLNIEMLRRASSRLGALTTPEGDRLPHNEAFSFILKKANVSHKRKNSLLHNLKLLQLSEYDMSLLDESEVPLHQQVLSEKRLATYYGDVSIGSCGPHQKNKCQFKVLMDTGSCEFWIPSHNCKKETAAARCDKHSQFDPSYSKTFKPFSADKKMCIEYLSGKVEGFMGQDTVGLGPLQVTGQVFGMADRIDVPLLDDVVWDGIIGLAYPNKALQDRGVTPVFDTIKDKKLLANNVFSYYLGRQGGAVTFGGVDPRFFHGDDKFRYAAVTEKGYWSIEIMHVVLTWGPGKEEKLDICKGSPNGRCKTIVDTGTYLIYGPRDQVTDPKGLGQVKVDQCHTMHKQPKITFVMYAGEDSKPARLTLNPADYTLQFKVPSEKNKVDCVIGIAPDNDSGWTLGQAFLRSYYTVFDRDQDKVGFVRSNPDVSVGSTHGE